MQGLRPDLTADQAWQVLLLIERKAVFGLEEETIELWARKLFPEFDNFAEPLEKSAAVIKR